MNEIKHIHLGRTQFTISVEAYKQLHDYLMAIGQQVEDGEVTDEVEARMAELLTERGIRADKVVLPADVAYLKEQLGEPADFVDDEQPEHKADRARDDKADAPKRLYRNTQRGMIAGVAAGLAEYIGVDATIVRILFVVLTLASGSGILVYIILWLIVPEAKTGSDVLQMRGRAVTVDGLKDVVARADVPGAARRASSVFGRVIESAFKVVLAIAGGVLAFMSAAVLLSLLTGTALLLTRHGKVAGEVFFPIGANETWGLLMGVASAGIILLLLLLAGISMVRRKWQIPGWGVAALFGLLFVTAPITAALAVDAEPAIQHRIDALHRSEAHALAPFKNLDANGHDTRFVFVPDTKYKVVYKYLGNTDLKPLHTEVSGDTLHINSNGVTDKQLCAGVCLYSGPDLQIEVHAPSLDKVNVRGSEASFTNQDTLRQSSITLDVAGDVYAHVMYGEASKAVLHANGSGTRHLELTLTDGVLGNEDASLDEGGTARLTQVGELDFTTDRACDAGDPYVFLMNVPDKLSVNGQAVTGDLSNYESLRNGDKAINLNCLIINAVDGPVVGPLPAKELPSDNS